MSELSAPEIIKGNTVTCPACALPHALFYVRSTDKVRKLCYVCNKAQHKTWNKEGDIIWHTYTATRSIEFVDGLQIEERWTKKYAKLVESRQHIGVVA